MRLHPVPTFRIKALHVVASALLLSATAVHAQYQGGIKFSAARDATPESPIFESGLATPVVLLDEFRPRYGLRLAYRTSPEFAVETIWQAPDVSRFNQALITTPPQRAKSIGLDLARRFNAIDNLAIVGRVGVHRLKPRSLSGFDVLRDTNVARAGLSIEYAFTKSLGLRFEAERFKKLSGNWLGGAFDGDNVTLGVSYRF